MIEHKLGSPARDGQFDPPQACSACGRSETTTEARTVVRSRLVSVPHARGANRFRMVCAGCLSAAIRSLGPGTPDAHTRTCSAPHADTDDTRFAVVATWPPHSYASPPYWLACAQHLSEALDAVAAERTTP